MDRRRLYYISTLLLIVSVIVFTGSCSTVEMEKGEGIAPIGNYIQRVQIDDYSIRITSSDRFEYTLTRTGDPFKVYVELKGVSSGEYTDRIVSKKAGISEVNFITPSDGSTATVVEITMTSPYEMTHTLAGNELSLTLSTSGDSPGGGDSADIAHELFDSKLAADEPTHSPNARTITGVSFKREKDAVNLIIHGDGTMQPVVSPHDNTIIIDIQDVKLAAELPKEIAVPLQALRWEEMSDKVRIYLELQKDTPYEVLSVNDMVIVSLTSTDVIQAAVRSSKTGKLKPAEIQMEPLAKEEVSSSEANPAKENTPAAAKNPGSPEKQSVSFSTPGEGNAQKSGEVRSSDSEESTVREICGRSIDCGISNKLVLDFQNADINAVLDVLSKESGCNIVVHPDVKGNVTMHVRGVYWYQVVNLIQKNHNLGCEVTGNIVRIAPQAVLADERRRETERIEQERLIQKAQEDVEDLQTKIFHINYAKVAAVRDFIVSGDSRMVTDRGKVSIDERTSSLIVKDIAKSIEEIDSMIRKLDKPTPQVLIEARIVEVNDNSDDTLGVNWGFFNKAPDRRLALGGAVGSGMTGASYLADMPTTTGTLGSGIAMGFINAQRTLGLDLKLQALETSSKGKIVTNPRVLTMNNQKATIAQGENIPYPVMNQQGVISAAFRPVTVNIEVTPQITPENSIILYVKITKEDFVSFTKVGGSDTPRTTTLSEETNVLIKDGETLVLGGVYKWDLKTSEEGTPGLKDIPILGWAFKSESVTKSMKEYLIFITPRIISRLNDEEPHG